MNYEKNYRSVYYYDDVDVLKNKLNIKDFNILEKRERRLTAARIYNLHIKPIKGKFDFKHLSKIHNYIFQDIYEWAGKIRNEEIFKGGEFAPSHIVGEALDTQIFKPLKDEKYLKGLNAEKLSERLAYYMSELNYAHPFREGNGRTQREFIRSLAAKNGYEIDWNRLDPEKLLNATVEATRNMKYDNLSKLIYDGFTNKEPLKDLIKMFDFDKDYDR